ncbi:MAG: kelch repeat-containing protein [Bryobacteraceae bacterium]
MKLLWGMTLLTPLLLSSMEWRERAPLPQARAGCAAGTIGKRMVVAGGSYWEGDKKYWSERTDLFDPATNTWSPGTPMPQPRSDAASATFRGSVYVFGGVTGGALSNDALQFDGHRWATITEAKLPAAAMYPVAAAVDSGILLLGGLTSMGDLASATRSLWMWSPGSGWGRRTDFPGASRVSAAVTASDGKMYVFGGIHQDTAGGPLVNLQDAWSYDVGGDSWTEMPKLPVARRAWAAVAMDGRILLLGGYTDSFSADIYSLDPKSQEVRLAGALPHPLADARFVRIEGRVLTAGGESGNKIRSNWTFEGRK